MKTSIGGKLFIQSFEKCSLNPYIDDVGVATIGWGNTFYPNNKKVTIKDSAITQVLADELFNTILLSFEKGVNFLLGKTVVNQNQYDALISFSYNVGMKNLGISTLLKKVLLNPSDASIPGEFLKWNKGGGKVLRGLTIRRTAESNIYLGGIYVNHN